MWSLCLLSLYSVSVVCHDSAIKECKRKLAEAYALNKRLDGSVTEEDLKKLRRKLEEDENPESNTSRTRQKLIGWTPGYCFLSWQAWHNAGRTMTSTITRVGTMGNNHLTYELSNRLKVPSLHEKPSLDSVVHFVMKMLSMWYIQSPVSLRTVV